MTAQFVGVFRSDIKTNSNSVMVNVAGLRSNGKEFSGGIKVTINPGKRILTLREQLQKKQQP